jgi:hypothetical protein
MKYVLIHLADEIALAGLPPAELDRIVAEKTKIGQELWAQGKEVIGQRLWPTATATRVARVSDRYITTDGPFTETKEVVGGFDIIQCASREEALEWARRHAVHDGLTVEVRPAWERCLCHGSYTCSSRL